jgi:hypothetical protein
MGNEGDMSVCCKSSERPFDVGRVELLSWKSSHTLCQAELTCKYTLSGSICFTQNIAKTLPVAFAAKCYAMFRLG